jgi:hypothetical protein
MDDDGSREYAVRELGEDAVRALEIEVVKVHGARLSPGNFAPMGIPTASILEGLGWEPGAPARNRLWSPEPEGGLHHDLSRPAERCGDWASGDPLVIRSCTLHRPTIDRVWLGRNG